MGRGAIDTKGYKQAKDAAKKAGVDVDKNFKQSLQKAVAKIDEIDTQMDGLRTDIVAKVKEALKICNSYSDTIRKMEGSAPDEQDKALAAWARSIGYLEQSLIYIQKSI